ncbi:hypothetical protein [Streptomyces sp. NBC_00306]|uniref:hypothetical protein n=1 Tax=Streptomyces sp. NBC_00306 TaxID=2975708 RepID=UPI002E286339|nr:hypothetical protein [Streptomyces sp. NBC_00306]
MDIPPCWFRLPPGFIDIAPEALPALRDQVIEDLAVVCPDPPLRDQRMRESEVLLGLLSDLQDQGTLHVSFGLHRGDDAEVTTSVLTLSNIPTRAPTATLAAAHCALQLVLKPMGSVVHRELLDLPCGTPAALVSCLLSNAPVDILTLAGVQTGDAAVFQARLGVARPTGSDVLVIDLTTTALDHAEEYTEILRGIGQTISFTDPTPQLPGPRQSRLWEAMQ